MERKRFTKSFLQAWRRCFSHRVPHLSFREGSKWHANTNLSKDTQTYVEPEDVFVFIRSDVVLPQSGNLEAREKSSTTKATSTLRATVSEGGNLGYNHCTWYFPGTSSGIAPDIPITYVRMVPSGHVFLLKYPVIVREHQRLVVSIRSPKS